MPQTSQIQPSSLDDKFNQSCNYIVMSDAGKPIFSSKGSEEEIARVCGLVQSIRTALNYSEDMETGDIRCLRSKSMTFVFLNIECITLVGMARSNSCEQSTGVEVYMQMMLEYIYSQIIMAMTETIHSVYRSNSSFDLRTVLGTTENFIRGIIDDASFVRSPAPFLSASVETIYPFSPELRNRATHVLKSVGDSTPNTVFAMLVVGTKLLTVVQSSYRPHQIRVSDLHIILACLKRQSGILTSDLWLPLCLPRFNSFGFLHCYTHCLDENSRLCLVLLSQHGSEEQFDIFRNASTRVKIELGFPKTPGSVLEIVGQEETYPTGDIPWRLSHEHSEDDDYVDASGDGDKMIPYEPPEVFDSASLVKELELASDPSALCKEYMQISGASHVLFRFDAPIHGVARESKECSGHLSQCISFYDGSVNADKIWSSYHRLCLRLRLGSASVESALDVFDMIVEDHQEKVRNLPPTVIHNCPALALVESPPNIQGLSYIVEGEAVFLAMNGHDFEL